MKLYFYELYKLLSKRMFLFLFAIFFIVNIFLFIFIQNSSDENKYVTFDRAEYHQKIENYRRISNDKVLEDVTQKCKIYEMCSSISYLMSDSSISSEELKDALADYETSDPETYKTVLEVLKQEENYTNKLLIYRKIKKQYEYFDKYKIFLNEMEKRAENQVTFSVFADTDGFSYNNIQKTPKDFESLKGIELKSGDYTGVEKGTEYNYTDFFIIAVVFLMCVYIFAQEREKSLLFLIKSTKNGQLATAVSKILALFTFTILTCLLFYGSDIIASGYMYDIQNLNSPIQSIQSFMNCNLKITVLQYLILWIFCKIFTVITIGTVFAGIFLLLKNSIQIYTVCGVVIVAEYILYIFIPRQSPINHFKNINIMKFLNAKELLGNYLNLNFFTNPVNLIHIYILFCLSVIILFSALSLFAFAKQKQIITKTKIPILCKIKERFFRIRGSVNIFSAEMFKLFIQEKIWIILVIVLCLSINASMKTFSDNIYYSIPEITYHSYLSDLEGKITPEKEEYIKSEQEYFDELSQESEKLLSVENPTREQKNKIENIKMIFEGKYQGFIKLVNQYEYLKAQNQKYGTEIYFIDERKYENIFTNSSNDWWQYIQTVIFLIISLGNIFAFEHKRNMSKLLKSTQNGKYRLAVMKYVSAAVVFIITFLAFHLPNLIVFYRQYGFIIGEAPASSMTCFENIPKEMSLLGILTFMYLTRFVICLSISFIITSLSEILENYFLTMTVSTVLFVFSGILTYNNINARIFTQIANGNVVFIFIMIFILLICMAVSVLFAVSKHSGVNIKNTIKKVCLKK